jgi:Uma2 family endonuclease
MYAQAGIQEFWIVNLIESKVEVYRQPLSSGIYSSRRDFSRGDALNLLAYADTIILVDEMFG